MKDFVIFADSTCDLGADLREKYHIDYVAMNYVIDGKEYPASLDWEVHSPKEFYDKMRNGIRITTTQVPMPTMEAAFRKAAEDGKDVLYIACSSALSGSYNAALVVAQELKKELPDTQILCVDSRISSLGQGYLAIRAAELRAEGKSIREVKEYLEANRLKVHQFATVATLDYLRRAGRVTASSAFFGNIFGIKPLLISDAKGQNYAIKKAKGRKAAMQMVVDEAKLHCIAPEQQTVFISHADAPEEAEALKQELLKQLHCKDVYISYIGPIVGASVGPGTLGVYFVGDEVTIVGEA